MHSIGYKSMLINANPLVLNQLPLLRNTLSNYIWAIQFGVCTRKGLMQKIREKNLHKKWVKITLNYLRLFWKGKFTINFLRLIPY